MAADCHMHMVLDGVDWKNAILRHEITPDIPWIREQLARYQALGYTYLRDGGDRWGVGAAARAIAGEYGIEYRTPLAPLCLEGHYGGFIGLTYRNLKEYAQLVRDMIAGPTPGSFAATLSPGRGLGAHDHRALPGRDDEGIVPYRGVWKCNVTGLIGREKTTDHVGAHDHRALPGRDDEGIVPYRGGGSGAVSYRVTPSGVQVNTSVGNELSAGTAGADFIKIMISGLMDFNQFGKLTLPSLPREHIRELIAIAHDAGMAVMAHANGADAVIAAAEAGVDSVEHGAYLNDEALSAMAENRVVWVPTLSTVANLRGKGRFPEDQVKKILECNAENVVAFHRMGGFIAPGSDAGAWAVPHGADTEYSLLAGLGVDEKSLDRGAALIQEKFKREDAI